ncbi:UvrB/UvrC motif-containing protein, partial [Micrococcus sp. SIMBA_131]
MDEAGAKMNLTFAVSNHDEIQQRLHQIATEKNKAAEAEDYELAAKLRTEELQLEKQLEETLKNNSNANHSVDLEEIQ